MQEQETVPDAMIYNALISTCEKGEQPERALEVCSVM